MKLLFSIFLILVFSVLSAQNQNPGLQVDRANKWYFGSESSLFANDAPSLHFDSGSPIVMKHGEGRTGTTISDPSSNLQLYGHSKIFNRLHNEMTNSNNDIGGQYQVARSSIAVPKPDNPDIIYYFTVPGTLYYSVIDITASAGLGEVVEKNVVLHSNQVGRHLAAVHHCNGKDVWVVTHEFNSRKFLAYLITENGIDTIPVVSELDPISNAEIQGGRLKFSPNGNKLAITFQSATIIPTHLYDFDKTTGIISNPIALISEMETALSFSPDNSKLYVGATGARLFQYDVEAGNANNIILSRKAIIASVPTTFRSMQLGRDGKIYVEQAGAPHNTHLGVINHPNISDTLCDFNTWGLYLEGAITQSRGLMNTIESYFYTGSSAFPCYGDTLVSTRQSNQLEFNTTKVYPNPFSDYANIEINGVNAIQQGQITYQLYDVLGRIYQPDITELQTYNGNIKLLFKKNNLPKGNYYLTVNTPHKKYTLKLSIF